MNPSETLEKTYSQFGLSKYLNTSDQLNLVLSLNKSNINNILPKLISEEFITLLFKEKQYNILIKMLSFYPEKIKAYLYTYFKNTILLDDNSHDKYILLYLIQNSLSLLEYNNIEIKVFQDLIQISYQPPISSYYLSREQDLQLYKKIPFDLNNEELMIFLINNNFNLNPKYLYMAIENHKYNIALALLNHYVLLDQYMINPTYLHNLIKYSNNNEFLYQFLNKHSNLIGDKEQVLRWLESWSKDQIFNQLQNDWKIKGSFVDPITKDVLFFLKDKK